MPGILETAGDGSSTEAVFERGFGFSEAFHILHLPIYSSFHVHILFIYICICAGIMQDLCKIDMKTNLEAFLLSFWFYFF